VENGCRSIAFPSISTGVYHFPLEDAAQIAVSTAKQFVAEHPDALDVVNWVLFDTRTLAAYEKAL
jgi:O-acetyl-ADP-ribose deacetylase (regulator of RNase III)